MEHLDKDTETEIIARFLEEAIEGHEDFAGRIISFQDAGLLTSDSGIVLTDDDGNEFQITIVQSR